MDNGNPLASDFARDVRTGLCRETRKCLPAKYLYDDVGAALFEAITRLPEYGLARADERVVNDCATILPACLAAPEVIVTELGSGSGAKTRRILEAFPQGRVLEYHPIDISQESLALCQRRLDGLVPVKPFHGTYSDGLDALSRSRPTDVPMLLLFLGSSIGNLDPAERSSFLAHLHAHLLPGDWILLGFDLMTCRDRLLQAYDDPTGVTAAFNRNVLGRVNRELAGDFDITSFGYVVRYDETHRRVEMHLRSDRDQQVVIPGAGATCRLRHGETIWTESSYKFRPADVHRELATAGFAPVEEWIDDEWPVLEGLWTIGG